MLPDDRDLPVVRVRVARNVDNLREGYEAEVELTPRIDKLIAAGYLLLLGHVTLPAEALPVADVPRVKRPGKKKAVDDASSTGGS